MSPYLLKTLDMGPLTIARLVAVIPTDRYDGAVQEGRFNLREVVAHLADWEPIFRHRLQQIAAEPGVTIEVFDEAQIAIDHDYAHADVAECVERFRRERAETATFLRALNPSTYLNSYIHPEYSTPLTLDDQANMLTGHDLYHIEQLSAYLA